MRDFIEVDDMSPGKRVAFYLRVSTAGQTVENQRQDLQRVADQRAILEDKSIALVAEGLVDEYRLMLFCGPGAGQTVFHLHWHVLGGVSLPGFE